LEQHYFVIGTGKKAKMTNIRPGYLQQVPKRFKTSLVKDVRKLKNGLKSLSQVNASQLFWFS